MMNRKASILFFGEPVGELEENENGFIFNYSEHYCALKGATPISHSLPIKASAFTSDQLFPFFDGLIPEGWLLDLASECWKINPRDRMGLLLACCKDCIGAVSVIMIKEAE